MSRRHHAAQAQWASPPCGSAIASHPFRDDARLDCRPAARTQASLAAAAASSCDLVWCLSPSRGTPLGELGVLVRPVEWAQASD